MVWAKIEVKAEVKDPYTKSLPGWKAFLPEIIKY